MLPSPAKFSVPLIKASWWLGTALLALGLFIKITSEPLEHEVSGVDPTIKDYIDRARPEVISQLVEVSGLSYPSGIRWRQHPSI